MGKKIVGIDSQVLATAKAEYAAMKSSELKKRMASAFLDLKNNVVKLAVIVTEMESRKLAIDDADIVNMLPTLRRVANGTLLPSLVWGLASRREILKRVETYPVEEQGRLASGPIEVVTPKGVEKKNLQDLSRKETQQVLRQGKPRNIEEQYEYLEKLETPVYERPKTNPPRVEWKNGALVATRYGPIPRDKIVAELGKNQDRVVHFTKTQDKTLGEKAAAVGLSVEAFIREAVLAKIGGR